MLDASGYGSGLRLIGGGGADHLSGGADFDTDCDGSADHAIVVPGVTELTASDFLFPVDGTTMWAI